MKKLLCLVLILGAAGLLGCSEAKKEHAREAKAERADAAMGNDKVREEGDKAIEAGDRAVEAGDRAVVAGDRAIEAGENAVRGEEKAVEGAADALKDIERAPK
jgi:hypothetical protein